MSVQNERFGEVAVVNLLDGRYELRMEIGRGATGVVWEAFDRVDAEVVAVKVLHQHLLSSESAGKRFLREARSAGLLNHPHSVAVKAHGCGPDGDAYLVMERLYGVTLTTLLAGQRPLPQPRAIRIVAQVLEAAAAAHSLNILHRDLKPNNVMLIDRDGDADFVKVCDFGLAKEVDAGVISSQLTGHGEVCGTPAYMAPEQARGEPLDGRADVYSVAVMLFQAVVGRPPFQASSAFGLASLHISAPPPRPSELRSDIAFFPPLEALILRALSKDKADRPSSAEVFRADLLQVERDYKSSGWRPDAGREAETLPATGGASASASASARKRWSKQRLLALAGATLVVIGAGSLAASRTASHPDRNAAGPVAAPVAQLAAAPAAPPPADPRPAPAAATDETAMPVRAPSSRKQASAVRTRPRARKAAPAGEGAPDASTSLRAPDASASLRAAEEKLAAGDIAEACGLGQAAAKQAPGDAATWEFLGRCYMRLPDPRRARAYYREYLSRAPEGPKAAFIRAIVEREQP